MNQTKINRFKDLGIEVDTKAFSGEKINIMRVLNQDIVIEDFRITPSKFEGKGDCLTLQIQYEDRQRVIFVGSNPLMEIIKQIPRSKFPIQTQIVKENGRYILE